MFDFNFELQGIGGATNYAFPQNTGYPLKKGNKKILMFEYHFDNPSLQTGNRFYIVLKRIHKR